MRSAAYTSPMTDLRALAAQLAAAHAGAPLAPPVALRTAADAYAVQDLVWAKLRPGQRPAAWKVGGPDDRVEPTAAPLLAVHASPARVRALVRRYSHERAVAPRVRGVTWMRRLFPWVAVLCLTGQRLGWERRRLLTFVLGVGLCWMTAFGPATEAATYCLLAPVLAWTLLQSRQEVTPWWITILLLTSLVLLLSSQVVVWFPGLYKSYRFLGPQPVGALLLLAALIATEFRRGRRVQGIIPASPAPMTWA